VSGQKVEENPDKQIGLAGLIKAYLQINRQKKDGQIEIKVEHLDIGPRLAAKRRVNPRRASPLSTAFGTLPCLA
jgi:hypothetical protein